MRSDFRPLRWKEIARRRGAENLPFLHHFDHLDGEPSEVTPRPDEARAAEGGSDGEREPGPGA